MSPFEAIPTSKYKPENFFPCISEEYRRCVRQDFWIMTKEDRAHFIDNNPEYLDDEREPFDYEKPNYDPVVYDVKPIEKGHRLDLVSLLSGGCQDGRLIRCVNDNPYEFDQVGLKNSLMNKKYVLIVCVFAPAKWCQFMAESYSRLSVLSSELLSSQPHDFEMVIVVKMRHNACTGCDYGIDYFHQFLSAFPGRLAVPYSEAKIRDSVCVALGFEDYPIKAVLVGPNSTVLQDDVDFLIDYGSIGFPFTDDRLKTLSKKREKISLSGLLSRDKDFRLHKLNPHKETESQSIEQLNEKVVGLYLFQRGDKLRLIHEIYNRCRDRDIAKGMEPQFEIVFVCMPFHVATHPHVFQYEVFSLLDRLEFDFSSWWVFPYDNSACLRLWEISKKHCRDEDGMIIVGPHNGFFDPCGAHVIFHFGIAAYPFTREVIVQRYLKRAKKVTLESLLLPPYKHATVDGKRTYAAAAAYMTCVERGDGEQVSLTGLRGKNVIFYLNEDPIHEPTFSTLVDWYPKIKDVDPYFELVFVTHKDAHFDIGKVPKSWLVCVCEGDHFKYLEYHHDAFYAGFYKGEFRRGMYNHEVIAFGKDGYIHMLNPLRIHYRNIFPFDPSYKDDLRREIIREISCFFEFYDFMYGYEDEPEYPTTSLKALSHVQSLYEGNHLESVKLLFCPPHVFLN